MIKWTYVFISEITDNEINYYFSLMSEEKKQRILAHKKREDKYRTIAGEMLARKMLSGYHNIPEDLIIFETGEYGKPFAIGCAEFNISHSDDMVVCCISEEPIGIDVERIKPFNLNIIKKVCTDNEIKYVLENSKVDSLLCLNEKLIHRFYEVWTTKEAYFKCIGTGIQNFKSVSLERLDIKRQSYTVGEYLVTIVEE